MTKIGSIAEEIDTDDQSSADSTGSSLGSSPESSQGSGSIQNFFQTYQQSFPGSISDGSLETYSMESSQGSSQNSLEGDAENFVESQSLSSRSRSSRRSLQRSPQQPSKDLLHQSESPERERPSISEAKSLHREYSQKAEQLAEYLKRTRPSIPKARDFYRENRPSRIKVSKAFSQDDIETAQQTKRGTGFRINKPGEKLRNPIKYRVCGSYKDIDEFGIGISLYFRQLLLLFVVLFLCSLANINSLLSNSLFSPTNGRFSLIYGSVYGAERNDLSLRSQGINDLMTCTILFLFTLLLKRFERKNVELIDTSQQTPKDYTVRVRNLPKSVTTEMLHNHFIKYGDIVFVSTALGNGELLKILRKSREINFKIDAVDKKKLWMALHNKKSKKLQIRIKKLMLASKKLSEKAKKLSSKSFPPHSAYITFNNEASQRECMKDMSVGGEAQRLFLKFFALLGCCSNGKSVLKGKVLYVDVPVEESEIFYENLHVSFIRRFFGKGISYFLTCTFLGISFYALQSVPKTQDVSLVKTYLAACIISGINGFLPVTLKVLTNVFEISSNYSEKQVSMFIKLLITRCINTAFLLYLATDFEDMFSVKTLMQIQGILIADCLTTPLIRLLNIPDTLNRCLFARFKESQIEMNALFKGTPWNLAERYTDMIKTLFVGLFYSTILPSSLIVTAVAMVITYWVDKYCLFRMWSRSPAVDESLARISRKMIVVCVWVHLIMARIFFANWPYADKQLHKSNCHIGWCSEPEENWTYDQRTVVKVYTSVGTLVFLLIVISIVWFYFLATFRRAWCSNVSDGAETTDILFRNLDGMNAYIPKIESRIHGSLIACNLVNVPVKYVPFRANVDVVEIVNPATMNLCSATDLHWMENGDDRKKCFGKCHFYSEDWPDD